MVNNTKEIGLKINKMALEQKHGKMVLVTKDSLNKGKKMDQEYLNGLTDAYIMDNFLIIICMAKVNINFLMEDIMMVNGMIINWMAWENLNGQMVENIQDNTKMIIKMVKVPLFNRMVDVMKGIG